MTKFLHDLDRGHEGESNVTDLFERDGMTLLESKISQGKNSDYDSKYRMSDGSEVTIEVKTDDKHAQTDRVALETHANYNKPRKSGISITKADFIAYVISHKDGREEIRLAATHTLQQLAQQASGGRWTHMKGWYAGWVGDNGNAYNVCVPYETFAAHTEHVCYR